MSTLKTSVSAPPLSISQLWGTHFFSSSIIPVNTDLLLSEAALGICLTICLLWRFCKFTLSVWLKMRSIGMIQADSCNSPALAALNLPTLSAYGLSSSQKKEKNLSDCHQEAINVCKLLAISNLARFIHVGHID